MKKLQRITITIKGTEGNIQFKEQPSLIDLARCRLLFDEIMEHNFSEEYILAALDSVRKSTQNIEEVYK